MCGVRMDRNIYSHTRRLKAGLLLGRGWVELICYDWVGVEIRKVRVGGGDGGGGSDDNL